MAPRASGPGPRKVLGIAHRDFWRPFRPPGREARGGVQKGGRGWMGGGGWLGGVVVREWGGGISLAPLGGGSVNSFPIVLLTNNLMVS